MRHVNAHYLDWNISGGFRNRIVLALESKMPNEVEWALNRLVQLSFHCPDNFSLAILPGLLDVILESTEWFVNQSETFAASCTTSHLVFGTSADPFDVEATNFSPTSHPPPSTFSVDAAARKTSLIQLSMIVHLLRNFSFIPANAALFLAHEETMKLLNCCLYDSPLHTPELRVNAMEAIENLSSNLVIRSVDDALFQNVLKSLNASDRALIIAATRTLTNFYLKEGNGHLFFATTNESLVRIICQRFFQLLLLRDEELVSVILEFLYHCTNPVSPKHTHVVSAILEATNSHAVQILVTFMSWHGVLKPFYIAATHTPTGILLPASHPSSFIQNSSAKTSSLTAEVGQDDELMCEQVCSQWYAAAPFLCVFSISNCLVFLIIFDRFRVSNLTRLSFSILDSFSPSPILDSFWHPQFLTLSTPTIFSPQISFHLGGKIILKKTQTVMWCRWRSSIFI